MPKSMFNARAFLVFGLALTMTVSSVLGSPVLRQIISEKQPANCCQGNHHSESSQPKSCDSNTCQMQCCRIVTPMLDVEPAMAAGIFVARAFVIPPASHLPQADPELIFHPPRAASHLT
jgi:hypothetical protein